MLLLVAKILLGPMPRSPLHHGKPKSSIFLKSLVETPLNEALGAALFEERSNLRTPKAQNGSPKAGV